MALRMSGGAANVRKPAMTESAVRSGESNSALTRSTKWNQCVWQDPHIDETRKCRQLGKQIGSRRSEFRLVVWLVIRAIQWTAALIAAVAAVRLASALVAPWRPPETREKRRDARWFLAWLLMLAVALALVRCQAGSFFSFLDPSGHNWNFDAHGWPLAEPKSVIDRIRSGGLSVEAIYWTAIAADILCSLMLLAATRLVIDRWLAAWDTGAYRWQSLGREAAGWCLALLAVFACEGLAARPLKLPGTELILYSTLIYEEPLVRAGVLIGLTSAVFLMGIGVGRGAAAVKRLRSEGVI